MLVGVYSKLTDIWACRAEFTIFDRLQCVNKTSYTQKKHVGVYSKLTDIWACTANPNQVGTTPHCMSLFSQRTNTHTNDIIHEDESPESDLQISNALKIYLHQTKFVNNRMFDWQV